MKALRAAIYDICETHQPLTVRNCLYQMVAAALIDKTQAEYQNVTVRLLGQMRESGDLPWKWIFDNTRWMQKPRSYGSLEDCLEEAQASYRRDLWQEQDSYVEVWCESDSAAGILYPATSEWDVPLMPCRGYASKTLLHEAGMTITNTLRPTQVLYFGDYDPSGEEIGETVRDSLIRYGADDIEFERCAVTPEQIDKLNLPGKPPKSGDRKAKGFQGECVEIEAIPPNNVRDICAKKLLGLIDEDRLKRLRLIERSERHTSDGLIDSLEDVA